MSILACVPTKEILIKCLKIGLEFVFGEAVIHASIIILYMNNFALSEPNLFIIILLRGAHVAQLALFE